MKSGLDLVGLATEIQRQREAKADYGVPLVLPGQRWYAATDGDPRALAVYLRHYSAVRNRSGKRRGSHSWKRIVGPGERLILLTPLADALFVWRRERYRQDGQHGVNCAVFRNESPFLSSGLIREASELAWCRWPGQRLFTFVDPRQVRSTNPGYCFLKAGWVRLRARSRARSRVILERRPEKEGSE